MTRSLLLLAMLATSAVEGKSVPGNPPAVPPGQAARPVASVALANAGFESAAPGLLGAPEGWWVAQHAGPLSYAFTLDTTSKRSGARSLKVANVGQEPFGSVYQKVPAAAYRGKTLRASGWIRTDEVKGNRMGAGVGLKLHAVRGGYPLEFVQMKADAVRGTTEWTRYEISLRIPSEADEIEVGLAMYGPGTAWLDDVALDVIDAPAPAEAAR